jgi:hypothetical protein
MFIAVLHDPVPLMVHISVDYITSSTHEIFQILPTCGTWKICDKNSPFTSSSSTWTRARATIATITIILSSFRDLDTKTIPIIFIAIPTSSEWLMTMRGERRVGRAGFAHLPLTASEASSSLSNETNAKAGGRGGVLISISCTFPYLQEQEQGDWDRIESESTEVRR